MRPGTRPRQPEQPHLLHHLLRPCRHHDPAPCSTAKPFLGCTESQIPIAHKPALLHSATLYYGMKCLCLQLTTALPSAKTPWSSKQCPTPFQVLSTTPKNPIHTT